MNERQRAFWNRLQKPLWVLCFLIGTPWYLASIAIVSVNEHREATAISDVLARKYGKELMFAATPRPTHTKLTVYGVLELSLQNEIVGFLQTRFERADWNPIEIKFFEKSVRNVTKMEDGSILSIRGNEVLIRSVRIDSGFGWW